MITKFWGTYGFLSNFWPSPFFHNGEEWATVEHYYQASKAIHPEDSLKIRQVKTPAKAKRMAREIVLRPDWEFIKTSIMLDAVRMKFTQNKDLATLLIETGSELLIEGNEWHDTFWGRCDCPRCGHGQNFLGRILMLVREEIRP